MMPLNVLRNLATFGAHGRIERPLEEYVHQVGQLAEAEALAQEARAQAANAIEELLERKREAVECVKRLASVENVPEEDRRAFGSLEPPAEDELPTLAVAPPLSAADIGIHFTKSVVTSLFAATSLLGMVGASGTGSVGSTATVLGREALAKVLTWLGVGGVSGGGLPVSAVAVAGVMVEALGATAVNCHRDAVTQISRIEKARASVQADLTMLNALVPRLEAIAKRAREHKVALEHELRQYSREFDLAKGRLQRRSWFGWLLEWFRGKVRALIHGRRPAAIDYVREDYRWVDKAIRPPLRSAWKLHRMVTSDSWAGWQGGGSGRRCGGNPLTGRVTPLGAAASTRACARPPSRGQPAT